MVDRVIVSTEKLEELNDNFVDLPEDMKLLVAYINYLEYRLACAEAKIVARG